MTRARAVGEGIKEEAAETLSEAGEKIREVKQRARAAASRRVRAVTGEARDIGRTGAGFLRSNALPLAVIGLGIGLLAQKVRSRDERWEERRRWAPAEEEEETSFLEGARDKAEDVRQGVREKAEDVRQGVREKAEDVREAVREKAHGVREKAYSVREKARDWMSENQVATNARDWMFENPLASGAAALAAGIGVGMLLPRTEREAALMGSTRDRLLGGARQTVEEVGRVARETGRAARDAATEATHH